MSAAPFVRMSGPVSGNPEAPILLFAGEPVVGTELTIHRVTETHHGCTLLRLGHAAEYLADSRRFLFESCGKADDEAVHILMELSRRVFEEYAEQVSGKRRLEENVVGWVTGWFEGRSLPDKRCV